MARRGHIPLSELTIRRAKAADAATVATIQVHGHRFAYAGILPQPASTEEWIARRTQVWASLLGADPRSDTFLAERDGRALGFVGIGPAHDEPLPPSAGKLFALYLEPDVIGTGIGRALLDHAVGELRARGFAFAVLWVLEENERARRFYERDGWSHDGVRKDEERDGRPRHELRYRRAL